MSQKALSEALNVPQNTLSQWESGKRTPDIATLIKIAEIFKVSVDYLVGRLYEPSEMCNMRVPFVGADGESFDECVYFTSHVTDRGRYRAIIVRDDAMFPTANEGDTVIFRKQLTADDNDAVVITVNGGFPMLRRIKWTDDGMTIMADSSEFEDVFYTNKDIAEKSVVICGKAVELRRRMKNDEFRQKETSNNS